MELLSTCEFVSGGDRLDEGVISRKPTLDEDTLPEVYPSNDLRRQLTTPLVSKTHHRALMKGLCLKCHLIAYPFLQSMTVADLRRAGPRYVNNIRLAKKDSSCTLCNFLSSLAYSASSNGGAHHGITSECSLHASTFSEVFFDAQDRPWFFDDDQVVFFISPLYSRGPKAADWALRNSACFMPLDGRSSGIFARELSPQADLGVVREWIQHCDHGHTHPDCNPAVALQLPGFQVIDCETRTLVTWQGPAPYATLSYVWGSDPTEVPGDGARLPETLPKLIEDAINVASFLGYRYLWIDRYCIPQDNDEVKAGLIRNMDKIYSESALTIIASASERPSEGLIGVGMNRTDLPYSLRTGDLGLVQICMNLADEVEKSRWNTRGWTYQEGFLSNRRLLFTKSQCYFQCGELWCTDGIRLPLNILSKLNSPGQAKLSRVFPWVTNERTILDSVHLDRQKQREEYFVDRVREYMKRELTHDMDAFDAFAGVLNYLKWFSGEFLVGDILGLPIWNTTSRWSEDVDGGDPLLRSLAWSLHVVGPYRPRRGKTPPGVVERRKGLPSWTWCGWKMSNPSFHQIQWSEGWRSRDNETSAQTEIRLEFQDGDVVRWESTGDLAELLRLTGIKGSPKFLRVRGWLSELLVPSECWIMNYDGECQCGPYRLARRDVQYLSNIAERRGLPLTEKGYILKAWFFTPLLFNVAKDNCQSEVLVLVETTEPGTYERLHVLCQIKMEYFIGRPSMADMAWRFNWDLTEFKVG